jgi:hypothetical protein
VKVNLQITADTSQNISGAEARLINKMLIAALKRCATQKYAIPKRSLIAIGTAFILAFLLIGASASAQDKDADKTAVPAAKKNQKKDEKSNAPSAEKKDKGEEKKGGMKADTFSGLKFRSVGPAVASGRVAAIAVNPKNKFEYYVGVASGGVWKTVNDGTTWTPVFDGEGSYSSG